MRKILQKLAIWFFRKTFDLKTVNRDQADLFQNS